MAILPVGLSAEEGGYQIERSLRFNSADSADLNRTFSTPTDNNRCTISVWIKKTTNSFNALDFGLLTTGVNTSVVGISGTGAYGASLDNKIFIRNNDTNKDYWYPRLRDNSAWYHIVIAINTDESTQADRAKLWINGVSQAANKEASGFSLSEALTFNTASTVHRIGSIGTSYSNYYANGYLAEYNFIDGQALDASYFGETDSDTGVWKPKAYSGSYGTNGFYLDFADNSSTTALGYDAAGSNDWTPNNFSVTAGAGNDSLVDSPTRYGTDTGAGGEVRGNYATLNPLATSTGSRTYSNGNLDVSISSSNLNVFGSFQIPTSGKWYWEFQITTIGGGGAPMGGVAAGFITDLSSAVVYRSNGDKIVNATGSSYGATYTTTDIIGVAADVDGGSVTFYKNGSSQGAITFAAGGLFPVLRSNVGTDNFVTNFGQRPFSYSAPSGFKALCTTNLPEPTIADGADYMNAVLYTGNGYPTSGTQSISTVGFQPDFVWIKSRTTGGYNHFLQDVLRGSTKVLRSNTTGAENTESTAVTSFNSNGFSLGANNEVNQQNDAFVSWNWKANGSGVSNTAGTINSTVSANTTAGFSIVTYTGNGTSPATIGHGLGVAPSMIIVKSRGTTDSWGVYHASLGNTGGLYLAGTNAFTVSSAFWNNTSPTSTVFTTSNNSFSNSNGVNYVAYCFAAVPGYSSMGSYLGNGSTDGPFIYTGFRPKFIIWKASSATDNWVMTDTSRSPYNAVYDLLLPNSSAAESTYSNAYPWDFLSNGFKIRHTASNVNGTTYIYAAFAENPTKFALAR